jgi:hypothetical protein
VYLSFVGFSATGGKNLPQVREGEMNELQKYINL